MLCQEGKFLRLMPPTQQVALSSFQILLRPRAPSAGAPSQARVVQLQPSSCHISYWIGCLIKIIIKIDLLISMHLLCRSHPCVPLSTEDVRADRRTLDPGLALPDGVGCGQHLAREDFEGDAA